MSNEIQKTENQNTFGSIQGFEGGMRMAKALCKSTLVPKEFQGDQNVPNVMIALEMAQRIGASPLAVMQSIYIIHGKPSWSSQFIISAINASGKFSPLRFWLNKERTQCYAWALEKETGERLESPMVSIEMAKAEGWMSKAGSKWKTMPELMLRYRAAAFFGRLYAPEILNGMHTEEENQDIKPVAASVVSSFKPTKEPEAPEEELADNACLVAFWKSVEEKDLSEFVKFSKDDLSNMVADGELTKPVLRSILDLAQEESDKLMEEA